MIRKLLVAYQSGNVESVVLSVIMHLKKHMVFKRNKAEANTCIICGRITGESKVSFLTVVSLLGTKNQTGSLHV